MTRFGSRCVSRKSYHLYGGLSIDRYFYVQKVSKGGGKSSSYKSKHTSISKSVVVSVNIDMLVHPAFFNMMLLFGVHELSQAEEEIHDLWDSSGSPESKGELYELLGELGKKKNRVITQGDIKGALIRSEFFEKIIPGNKFNRWLRLPPLCAAKNKIKRWHRKRPAYSFNAVLSEAGVKKLIQPGCLSGKQVTTSDGEKVTLYLTKRVGMNRTFTQLPSSIKKLSSHHGYKLLSERLVSRLVPEANPTCWKDYINLEYYFDALSDTGDNERPKFHNIDPRERCLKVNFHVKPRIGSNLRTPAQLLSACSDRMNDPGMLKIILKYFKHLATLSAVDLPSGIAKRQRTYDLKKQHPGRLFKEQTDKMIAKRKEVSRALLH